jgi:hypothetical protein
MEITDKHLSLMRDHPKAAYLLYYIAIHSIGESGCFISPSLCDMSKIDYQTALRYLARNKIISTSRQPHANLTPTSRQPHAKSLFVNLTDTEYYDARIAQPHANLTPTSRQPHANLTPSKGARVRDIDKDLKENYIKEKKTDEIQDELFSDSCIDVDTKPSISYSIGFLKFWKAYPKKIRKKEVRDVWASLALDEKANDIIAGVEYHKKDVWSKDDPKWIPGPKKYLIDERYLERENGTVSEFENYYKPLPED